MRIRSNLTDETIYDTVRKRRGSSLRTHSNLSGRSPKDGNSSGANSLGRGAPGGGSRSASRRLFRLVILLVLVLILMREAANPDVYRNFFGALGAPLVAEPMPTEISRDELAQLLEKRESSTSELPELDGLIAELGELGRQRLTTWLAEVRRSQKESETVAAPDPELLAMLTSAAAGSGVMDPAKVTESFELAAAQEATREAERAGKLTSDRGDVLRRELQMALDREYFSRVSDATIWSRGDADAFYRWLEIGHTEQLSRYGAPVFVGFVSLLDQPAVYRGGRVALRGTAVRAESTPAAENPFGVEQYWLVWVRPEDGSDRPIMGYAVDLPKNLQRLTRSGVDQQGPEVLLDGVFLRRHLYQSQKGSELAPVIVGRVRASEAESGQAAKAGNGLGSGQIAGERASGLGTEFVRLALVAALFAIGFTFVIVRYTAQNGKWRREVRKRGLVSPLEFLGSNASANTNARPDDHV